MKLKLLRKQWPKVRETFIRGNRYFVCDLRRAGTNGTFKNFTEREKALEFASSVGEKVERSGLDSLTATDPRIKTWNERAAIFNCSIDQIFEMGFLVVTNQQKTNTSPLVSTLLDTWVNDRTTDTSKPLRPRTAKTIRAMANQFKQDFENTKLTEMTDEFVDGYMLRVHLFAVSTISEFR